MSSTSSVHHLALNGAHCGALRSESLCCFLDHVRSDFLDEGLRLSLVGQTFEVSGQLVASNDDLRQLVPDQVVDDAILARVNRLPTQGTGTASQTCTNSKLDGVTTNQCFVEQSCARSVSHSPDAIEMPSPRGVGNWTTSVVLLLLQSRVMSLRLL